MFRLSPRDQDHSHHDGREQVAGVNPYGVQKKSPNLAKQIRGYRILSFAGAARLHSTGEKSYSSAGRSSDSRIILLAVPSPSHEEWHLYGFRPRSQRRVRNGFAPFSLKSLTDDPRTNFSRIILKPVVEVKQKRAGTTR